jgi:hypothetical protein
MKRTIAVLLVIAATAAWAHFPRVEAMSDAADSAAARVAAVIDADSVLAGLALRFTTESCVTDSNCVILVVTPEARADSTQAVQTRKAIFEIWRGDYRGERIAPRKMKMKYGYSLDGLQRIHNIYKPEADADSLPPPAPGG